MKMKNKAIAALISTALAAGAIGGEAVFAANYAFGIDEINWTDEDWASIAMTNDDTVQTGAVIRTQADTNSPAAGYLYRGTAVQVVDKGEEWTEVRSGKVSGFVKNEFLAYGDEARGLASHYGKQGVTANWDEVRVYAQANGQASVSNVLEDGALLGLVEDNGHWITIQSGKEEAGYVSEEDVTRVLLVDTAVPAEGEDDADVLTDMTSAPASEPAQAFEASSDVYEDAGYVEAPESAASYEEAPESTVSYEESAPAAQEAASSGETYASTTVSDDATIQALYDAFIEAQNAAMSCTSAEDAREKADAATAAWKAYLAACNGTCAAEESADASAPAASSDTQAAPASVESTAETTGQDTAAADAGTDDSSADSSASATDTSAAAAAAASTNTGSYAGYSDLDLLAAIIWCEAGNQPYDGMVAVGQVVMNRVKSSSFPNTIADVLNQPGQFTPASSGTLQAALAAGINSTCYAAAQDALNGAAPVAGYPLYFNTHSGSIKLGAHYFS